MHEYKSSLFVIGKNVVYGIAGGFIIALALSWFIDSLAASLAGAAAGLAILYFTIIGDNIRIVVTDDAVEVYRLTALKHSFKLADCRFNAKIVTSGSIISDSECNLTITGEDGDETTIDCSMLGYRRFMALLDDLGVTNPDPVEVPTTKQP